MISENNATRVTKAQLRIERRYECDEIEIDKEKSVDFEEGV